MPQKAKGILGLILGLLLALPAWAHEFHTSITDARYNPKTQTFELAVRVFADDLEEALSRRAKTVVRLDRSARVNQLIAEYVQAHLSISAAKGKKPVHKFIGVQEEADALWIYVEIPAGQVPAGQVYVQNALLMEVFTDQTNIVNVEVGGKKRSVLSRAGESQHVVGL
ncbi:DUF6702 family protein [Rufibacter sp. LB8]|uniref:DUF6702 family protein n=1 Tax=Rufibacter sp. LB8 TaxID=2777781 RepID=UPI00178C5804|nr:DUF6702 family protein [Rufibacter sp. LB8]